jgi:hypothetical protein
VAAAVELQQPTVKMAVPAGARGAQTITQVQAQQIKAMPVAEMVARQPLAVAAVVLAL